MNRIQQHHLGARAGTSITKAVRRAVMCPVAFGQQWNKDTGAGFTA